MRKIHFAFVLLGLLTLASCGSTEKGTRYADKFFGLLVREKFQEAGKMLDVAEKEDATAISQTFGRHPDLGKLQSAKKQLGFNTSYSNGVTVVRLPYELTYEQGAISVQVRLVDRGKALKIEGIRKLTEVTK